MGLWHRLTETPVRYAIEPEAWFTAYDRGAPYFRFGMPWPWEQVDATPTPSGDPDQNVTNLGYAYAPRSQGSATMVLRKEPGSLNVPGFEQMALQSMGGTFVSRSRMNVGGIAAVAITVNQGATQTTGVFCDRAGYLVEGQFDVPTQAAEGYGPHLATMLGTWEWYA